MQVNASATLFAGESLGLHPLEGGFVELRFDRRDGAVNMFDQRTVAELDTARRRLESVTWLRGILVTSAKDVFVVGADITEFTATFAQPRPQLLDYLRRSNEVFLRFEALDVPSVAAINGFALGGGLEFALVATHRVMAEGARIGLPEVGLGLIPGFGGTVRLPRVAGLAHALEWISDGAPRGAVEALRCGVVDRISAPEELREQALRLLRAAAADAHERRAAKRLPLAVADHAVAERRAIVARDVPACLPAAAAAVELLAQSAAMDAAQAQEAEAQAFATLAKSQAAAALVRNFINQQAVKRLARQLARGVGSGGGSPACVFTSPLPGATLVEIAGGADADAGAIARAAAEAAAAGKIALRVSDAAGGLVRRVHAACLLACEALLAQGLAHAQVDAAMRRAGWETGPFEGDAVLRGADAGVAARTRPAGAERTQPTGVVRSQSTDAAAQAGIVERVLLASILEAAVLLDEGVVRSAAEIDISLQLGLGFPRHLGGPLHHADWLGLPQVCELARQAGLQVPATLQARARRGERFYAAA
ncbi:hypothetical protein HHL11_26110 [Ramlibacter sp. G-1-2-2]|uniref:3-hydroxyacyl-CoA dehydrogenase n=1 Tax=Ramlibacter agri TaxID=2728837 RepID=A0A848HCN7_9BURK|nr:enoyl-CoA hydratase-related protein [Ramlibacter agri]NML47249.1 hypothetical protein [Ramlibacter agri]